MDHTLRSMLWACAKFGAGDGSGGREAPARGWIGGSDFSEHVSHLVGWSCQKNLFACIVKENLF